MCRISVSLSIYFPWRYHAIPGCSRLPRDVPLMSEMSEGLQKHPKDTLGYIQAKHAEIMYENAVHWLSPKTSPILHDLTWTAETDTCILRVFQFVGFFCICRVKKLYKSSRDRPIILLEYLGRISVCFYNAFLHIPSVRRIVEIMQRHIQIPCDFLDNFWCFWYCFLWVISA